MTFVLLGRDKAAPAAIRAWIAERIRLRKNHSTDPQLCEAAECAMQMELEQTIADEISLDEVSIDEAWLRSIGFSENANGVLCLNLGYMYLEWTNLESVVIYGSTKHFKTRGDLLQLFEALGLDRLLEKAK